LLEAWDPSASMFELPQESIKVHLFIWLIIQGTVFIFDEFCALFNIYMTQQWNNRRTHLNHLTVKIKGDCNQVSTAWISTQFLSSSCARKVFLNESWSPSSPNTPEAMLMFVIRTQCLSQFCFSFVSEWHWAEKSEIKANMKSKYTISS